jgi:peptidoglycan/xylan/chitin deacetylase (PgdA/CDA1 family)
VSAVRTATKRALAALGAVDRRRPLGATLLTYHRIGGGTPDELDLTVGQLTDQLDVLLDEGPAVRSLDDALDRLDAGDPRPSVVLTFDDGFADLYTDAWPLLRQRGLPFTVYVAAGLVGGQLRWEGSSADSQGATALTWDQLAEMHATGLCTVGNHTWDHAGPESVDETQLDRCSDEIERQIGSRPAHFAWTWGVPAPSLDAAVRARFRSVATGVVGRNGCSQDRWGLRRVPVRRSDPITFFRAKLRGSLVPERTYDAMVRAAKALHRPKPEGLSP